MEWQTYYKENVHDSRGFRKYVIGKGPTQISGEGISLFMVWNFFHTSPSISILIYQISMHFVPCVQKNKF